VLALIALLLTAPLGLDSYLPVPADNPLTSEKVELGRRLFLDRALSRDGTVACVTCHDPEHAFADNRLVARGIGDAQGRRNVPTIINRGYGTSFFWDGRAGTLEQQVVQPIFDPKEMGMTADLLLDRLRVNPEYSREIRDVADVGRALASFVRTIRSGDSRFDRHLAGQMGALTAQEEAGLMLFSSKANCWVCHTGPNFSDERFHNTGIAMRNGLVIDEGRFAVTADPRDHGAFKTPTLRDVALTAPYMHDGNLATLEDVVDYYDRGGNRSEWMDGAIRPLHLTLGEKRALAVFLRCLSGNSH
jgi:cytochrome c peroxidase